MGSSSAPTKILIVDSDEASFEIRQCIAKALEQMPPIELFHARDATEALAVLEHLAPDVVVLDSEESGESELFIDSLNPNHPPVVMCIEEYNADPKNFTLDNQITYIPKTDSLEGFHQTLMLAAAIGIRFTGAPDTNLLH